MRRLGFLSLVLGFLIAPHLASAATLFPSPETVRVAPGETVPVSWRLDSGGESVNALEARLTYPKDLLVVERITRGESAFSLWAEEPSVGSTGTISFVAGVPNGRVMVNAEALTVFFRGLKKGEATLSVDLNASKLALNDGAGTLAELTARAATVSVIERDPLLPAIRSETHPSPDQWTAVRDAVLRWTPFPASSYSYLLSRDTVAEPDTLPEENDGSVRFPALSDGLWYFTLKERVGTEAWSAVAQYRLMIDGTPPVLDGVSLVREPASQRWLLTFDAHDSTSGVARTELRVLRPGWRWFPFFLHGEWRTVQNPVDLGPQVPFGIIMIRTTDFAGNLTSVSLPGPDLFRQRIFFGAMLVVLVALLMAIRYSLLRSKAAHHDV